MFTVREGIAIGSRHGDTDEKPKDSTVGPLIVNVLTISSFVSALSAIKHTPGFVYSVRFYACVFKCECCVLMFYTL